MLATRYPKYFLRKHLPPYGVWKPYPTIKSRERWTDLPTEMQKNIILQGETCLEFSWSTMPASMFLEYKRNGNRSRYQNVRYARRYALRDLILAECVEAQGRFLDQIVNGIWVTCEETYWGVPAHINMQAVGTDLPDIEEPTVDLFAAETVALLAWAEYLLGDQLDNISGLVRPRIKIETQRRILEPCLVRDDFWWMGFDTGGHGVNNWNPWVNSNWLTSVLLLEEDMDRRIDAVDKILRSLDIFINIYGDAGGCDEGPGYWGRAAASLFDCLDQLYSASDGGINVYDEVKIKNMGKFIYRTHIADQYYVNYADASAVNKPSASLIYRYGKAIHDPLMMAFGAELAQESGFHQPGRDSLSRVLPRVFVSDEMASVQSQAPLPRDAYFDCIQVIVARDKEGETDGFFLSAKGGHNAESHNHNDVGNFIVFVDGLPVIVDAGVETYTKKTFSPERYEIWTMQSAYHNLLPVFDESKQLDGSDYKAHDVAYRADDAQAQFTLDLASAYPASAGLVSMQRTFTLNRGVDVVISDIVVLNKPVADITLSLLTPSKLIVEKKGVVVFSDRSFGNNSKSGAAILVYDAKFGIHFEQVPITDKRMSAVWGAHLNRIVFTLNSIETHDTWTWRIKKVE